MHVTPINRNFRKIRTNFEGPLVFVLSRIYCILSVNISSVLTIGTNFCCVDAVHKESIEYLNTGNESCSDCCDSVINKFFINSSENRTLYYRDGGDANDPNNPRCDKEFFSGCNVNFVSDSAVCRLVLSSKLQYIECKLEPTCV